MQRTPQRERGASNLRAVDRRKAAWRRIGEVASMSRKSSRSRPVSPICRGRRPRPKPRARPSSGPATTPARSATPPFSLAPNPSSAAPSPPAAPAESPARGRRQRARADIRRIGILSPQSRKFPSYEQVATALFLAGEGSSTAYPRVQDRQSGRLAGEWKGPDGRTALEGGRRRVGPERVTATMPTIRPARCQGRARASGSSRLRRSRRAERRAANLDPRARPWPYPYKTLW